MNSVEINKMAEFEKEYWWHRGKNLLVTTLINDFFPDKTDLKILEIGCGTGGLTKLLQKWGDVKGVDISGEAIESCKSNGLTNVEVQDITVTDYSNEYGKYDLILALDVLEHIDDDVAVMNKIKDMLKEGGIFMVNVPAYKFLWSEHDEALSHRRRYSMYELTKKLEHNGFKIRKNSFFVSSMFPLIAAYRLFGNFFGKSAYPKTSYVLLPHSINDFITKILYFEVRVLRKLKLPVGVTITVIAQK